MVSYDEPLPPAGDGEGLEDCGGNQESGEQLCVLLQQEERAHRASVSGAFYGEMLKHLTKEAKRLGCTIAELTYDYEGAPYDFVW